MWTRALVLILAPIITLAGVRERDVQATTSQGASYVVRLRLTCKKNNDGKGGEAGVIEVTLFSISGFVVEQVHGITRGCPSFEDAAYVASVAFGLDVKLSEPRPPGNPVGPRSAQITAVPSPAANRVYLTDTTGPNGRSAVEVFDTLTQRIITSIDVDNHLFGGLAVSRDGLRTYALMWQTSSPVPGPAFIAYIDTGTNAIVDRFVLPEFLTPNAPALSADGRYLYFAAGTQTTGKRVQIADLQAKTIVAVLPPAVPASFEPEAVELSPDGALLAAASQSGVLFYDLRTRTYLGRFAAQLPNARLRPLFHPNGSRVYVWGRALLPSFEVINFISVIDTATLTEVARIPITNPAPADLRDELVRLSITPGGQWLVLDESFQGTATVINTRTNKIVKTVTGLTTGSLASTVIVNR